MDYQQIYLGGLFGGLLWAGIFLQWSNVNNKEFLVAIFLALFWPIAMPIAIIAGFTSLNKTRQK